MSSPSKQDVKRTLRRSLLGGLPFVAGALLGRSAPAHAQFVSPVAVNASGGTTSRTLADRFRELSIPVTDFGAVEGSDMRAALVAAIAYASGTPGGGVVTIPRGDGWTFSLGASQTINLPANVSVMGEGIGATQVAMVMSNASQREIFTLNGKNQIAGFTAILSAVGAATYNFFIPKGDILLIEDIEFNGGVDGTGANWTAHFSIAHATTGASRVTIRNCTLYDYHRLILKANSDTSDHRRWRIIDNDFSDMWLGQGINSPTGDAEDFEWRGNSYRDQLDSAAANGFFGGCAGGTDIRYISNRFSGACKYALHFEECTGLTITNNEAVIQGGGFELLQNNIGGAPKPNDYVVISNNKLRRTDSKTERGISLIHNDATTPPVRYGVIGGNMVSGFEAGIFRASVSVASVVPIIGNYVQDCTRGIVSFPDPSTTVVGNTIDTCATGLDSTNPGEWGQNNKFSSVTTEVENDTDTRFAPLATDTIFKAVMEEDFLTPALHARWTNFVGSDGAVVAPTMRTGVPNGIVRLTSGAAAGGTMALNGVQMHESVLQWRASSGDLVFRTRIQISNITGTRVFFGFSDQVAALEMPFQIATGTDTLTSNATDAVGVLFSANATTKQWCLVGVAADVDATKQFTGIAPVVDTFEEWRIALTSDAIATFYRNGVKLGTAMTGAVTAATFLTPYFALHSLTNASYLYDIDYVVCQKRRF